MLNYNLNINSPLQQEKKNEDVRPEIYWDFHSFTSASDNSDLNEGEYGFMSINAPGTNCNQVSIDSGNNFTTDAQFPVTASVTGSNWPLTGSVTMSIFTSGITYDPVSADQFYLSTITASAATIILNPSITGSIVKNEFSASEFYRWYISGSIIAKKGNIYNGPINWKVSSSSTTQNLEGNQTNINGVSSSFELKKDIAVIEYYSEITSSINGSYPNFYSFNQTASITSNVNNTTGSVTMSILIPEAGISTSSLFVNKNTTTAFISASFIATTNEPYNITASIINNKGNESNSNINYLVSASSTTQDLEGNSAELNGNSSSFNLKKDIAVMATVSNIGAPFSASYKNNYSFNQTASLTSSILSNTTGSVTMSLEIPEIGFSTSSKFFNPTSAGDKILSASFEAQTSVSNYNITASVINNKGNQSNSNINYYITGSSAYLASSSFNIRKDANVTMVSQSFTASTSGTYKNDYAFNQTASLSSSFVPLYTQDSSSFIIQKLDMKIDEINFTQSLWISSSCGAPLFNLITASFEAQTSVPNYNITASIEQYQQSVFNFWITASGAGGGGGTGAGGGGGGGMVVSGSTTIQPNTLYTITIGEGGAVGAAGGDTTFIGCNRTINVYAGGGKAGGGTAGPGGDSGTGTIIENGVTSSAYPAFTGGTGASQSTGFGDKYAAGGGASNTANGANGVIDGTGAAIGGDGASGDSFGGGGGYQGAGPTPPFAGGDGVAGNGTLPNGAGGGGNGASTLGGGSGRAASAGNKGIVLIKYAGSGSLFTTTNASSSYNSLTNETIYTFATGSGTLFYQPIAVLS